jgi:hypothetical protein
MPEVVFRGNGLRGVYEKLVVRVCSEYNEMISAAECKEEVEKAARFG